MGDASLPLEETTSLLLVKLCKEPAIFCDRGLTMLPLLAVACIRVAGMFPGGTYVRGDPLF